MLRAGNGQDMETGEGEQRGLICAVLASFVTSILVFVVLMKGVSNATFEVEFDFSARVWLERFH